MTAAAAVVPPGADRRRWFRLVLLTTATVLTLAWLAGLTAWTLRPETVPAVGSSRFAPPDGRQVMAGWELAEEGAEPTRSQAMVDHSRSFGLDGFGAMSLATWRVTELPPQNRSAYWWHESVLTDDPQADRRHRLRRIGAEGIRLHAQQWGRRGITFGPAVLELPADVAPGGEWHGEGVAVADPSTTQLHYRSSGRAESADGGCLAVTTEIRLATSPESLGTTTDVWAESATWCPGRGPVQSGGSWRGARWQVSETTGRPVRAVRPEAFRPRAPDPARAAEWELHGVSAITSDATFGDFDAEPISPVQAVVSDGGVVSFVDQGTGALSEGVVLAGDDLWWIDYWIRAGGGEGAGARAARARDRVVTLTSTGSVLLAGTTGRDLTAYLEYGRRLWSVELDEVPTSAPVLVGTDQLAVATLAGSVYLLDAATGEVRWRHRGDEPVQVSPAAGETVVVVTDASGALTALDRVSGEPRWVEEEAEATLVAAEADRLIGASYSFLSSRDPRTGRERWARATTTSIEELTIHDDVVATRTLTGLELFDGRDGAPLGRLDDVRAHVRVGDRWMAATRDELLLLDDRARVLRRWPLPPDAGEPTSVQVGAGVVWLIGERDDVVDVHWLGTS